MNTTEQNNLFWEQYYTRLPADLQIKIMTSIDHWKQPPPPLFRKGQTVRYNESESHIMRNQKNRIGSSSGSSGPMPLGRLLIWSDPTYDMTRKEWLYEYEYGCCGNHEGCANESRLTAI